MIDAELFWSKVDKSGGSDACWPWTPEYLALAARRLAQAEHDGQPQVLFTPAEPERPSEQGGLFTVNNASTKEGT